MLYFNLKRNYIFLILLIFCSCTNSYKNNEINKKNVEEKIEEAFIQSELFDKTKPVIPILFFIDNKGIVFDDKCIQSKVFYLRAIKSYTLNDLESLLKNINLGLKVVENCPNSITKALFNNLLGIYYTRKQDTELAIKHYDKAIFYGENNKEKAFIVDAYINRCNLYLKKKNWQKVIENANQGILIIVNSKYKSERLKYFYTNLSEAYINLKEYDLAEEILLKAIETIAKEEKNNPKKDHIKFYRKLYLNKAYLNENTGKFDIAYKYMKSSDSLAVLTNELSADKLSDFVEKEKELKDKLFKSNKDLIFYHRIIISGALLFFIISLFLIYRLQNFSKKLKTSLADKITLNNQLSKNFYKLDEVHKKLIAKNEEVEKLLKYNEHLLLTKTLKISNYKDAVNNVIKKIDFLIEEKETTPNTKLLSLNRSLQQIISEEEIWEDFKAQFEKNRPDFFKKLLAISPDLSVINQKHCAYVAINLKSKEVANILNLSARSVETTRYRIKKKLEVGEETLQEFLNKL